MTPPICARLSSEDLPIFVSLHARSPIFSPVPFREGGSDHKRMRLFLFYDFPNFCRNNSWGSFFFGFWFLDHLNSVSCFQEQDPVVFVIVDKILNSGILHPHKDISTVSQ